MPDQSPIELLIFDCDGVLVDSEVIANRLLAEALTREGYAVTPEQCRERYTGISIRTTVAMVEADWGQRLPEDFAERLRARDLKVFARELRPIPGVADVLKRIPLRKCVASSGAQIKIRTSLETTGLLSYFEPHIFSSDQVANGKPSPDLFLYAARRMGVVPEHCCVVEDSEVGIAGALAAGMRVIGFAGGGHCGPGYADGLRAAGADRVVERMSALPEILAG
jgi:HAD superfamily hydrolase (TIGR01509 family)